LEKYALENHVFKSGFAQVFGQAGFSIKPAGFFYKFDLQNVMMKVIALKIQDNFDN